MVWAKLPRALFLLAMTSSPRRFECGKDAPWRSRAPAFSSTDMIGEMKAIMDMAMKTTAGPFSKTPLWAATTPIWKAATAAADEVIFIERERERGKKRGGGRENVYRPTGSGSSRGQGFADELENASQRNPRRSDTTMTAREFKLSRLRRYRSEMLAAEAERSGARRSRNSSDDDRNDGSEGQRNG